MRISERERALMRKRLSEHRRLHGGHESVKKIARGRFRKQDPHDCGNTSCQLCHFDKVHGRPDIKERRAQEAFRQDLESLSLD